MSKDILRIATRESPLAMWQAEYVSSALQQHYPHLKIELLPMTTRGDQVLDAPLAKIGGKGLFMKELEVAILEGRADIAVHSMKDVPMAFPESLQLAVICEREDCRDAFVSNTFTAFDQLPANAVVGSSSLRRQCQLKAQRPDIQIKNLRGNVNTRLRKLDAGEYDAIILAAAGLIRLDMAGRITSLLETDLCLPAGGQGAVGIECRDGDTETLELLQVLEHKQTALCVHTERAMNTRLNGGCQVPIASLATLADFGGTASITLHGRVGEPDGSRVLQARRTGPATEYVQIGQAVADDLLAQGAQEILARLDFA